VEAWINALAWLFLFVFGFQLGYEYGRIKARKDWRTILAAYIEEATEKEGDR